MMTCFDLQYDHTHGSSKLAFNTLQHYNNSRILKKFLLFKTGQVKEYKYPQAKYIHGKKVTWLIAVLIIIGNNLNI